MTSRTTQDPDLLRRLLRAKDRMTAAPAQAWSVAELARVSGVSKAHFARAFKQAFGVPPHRYLLCLRLERAKAFLHDTELPVTDVAFACGWNSVGTFGRTFRDVLGMTPTSFRAQNQETPREPAAVPACMWSAAHRPDLRTAVLEKRRNLRSD